MRASRLLELRLADGLGGKAYLLFDGQVADVEAAVEIGRRRIACGGRPVTRVIPQLHGEMRENLEADAPLPGRPASGGRKPEMQLAPGDRYRRRDLKAPGLEGVGCWWSSRCDRAWAAVGARR